MFSVIGPNWQFYFLLYTLRYSLVRVSHQKEIRQKVATECYWNHVSIWYLLERTHCEFLKYHAFKTTLGNLQRCASFITNNTKLMRPVKGVFR